MARSLVVLACLIGIISASSQAVLNEPTVSKLSFDTFSTLHHPLYPKHAVRVKKTKHCDGEVNAYSGYVDIEAKHIWFEFFESRNEPAEDPFVFWTNGGPGCSSAVGQYMEHGPCLILDKDGPKRNPYSWNERANVLYVHQPVNVGFSYAEHGEKVGTTEEAAADIAAFISILFDADQFAHLNLSAPGREVHMTGESYGGRFIPVFTAAILDANAARVGAGREPINVASVMLGNGLVDWLPLMAGFYEMQCTAASGVKPTTSISACVRMKQALPRCEKWMKESCVDIFDTINCSAAWTFCFTELYGPYAALNRNAYDITKPCEAIESDPTCYGESEQHLIRYLSLNSTQELLGVDEAVRGPFEGCNFDTVFASFLESADWYKVSYDYIVALLERGVRVLAYNGDYDFIVNWTGSERVTRALEWSGATAYRATTLSAWEVDGEPAGRWRGAGPLTFATIHGAGHMAPYDKPKQSLALFQRWIDGGKF